jgi:hypothetical protein
MVQMAGLLRQCIGDSRAALGRPDVTLDELAGGACVLDLSPRFLCPVIVAGVVDIDRLAVAREGEGDFQADSARATYHQSRHLPSLLSNNKVIQ